MLNSKNKMNTRKMKNIVILLLLCLLLCLPVISNAAVIEPNSDFYVNDSAKLLSSDTKQYIMNTSVELAQKTGAQIVVVTIPSLGNRSIEEYADELFNKWEIGDKEKENGVLLLCSYQDRQFRVEVGYGLEGTLTDGKTGRMQDEYIIPYLKKNNFDEGIKNGYSAFLQEVAKEYNVTITGRQNAVVQKSSSATSAWNAIFPLLLFIIVIIIFSRFGGGPFIFFGGPGGFYGGGRSGFGRRK